MAYSQGTAPLPPPPPMGSAFSHAYNLHQNATGNVAQQGIAPVNQMSNGFGGRQGGNPNVATAPTVSGGNRSSQHVATPGNNNVSYGSPSLLNSSQTLWQKAQTGGVGPVNGMSLGFIKNTQARKPGPAAPVTPAPTTTPTATTPPPPNMLAGQTAIGAAPTATTAAPIKTSMTINDAIAQFQNLYPGVARTYKAPDGSLRYTSQWANYLSTVNVQR